MESQIISNGVPKGFTDLRQNLISRAAVILEELAPAQVKAFRETISQRKGPEHGLAVLSGIHDNSEFNKWRCICIDLLDLELQMHRLENSLLLLKSPTVSFLSNGSWVDYHFNTWAILMQGLLYRTERLIKDVIRVVIRPESCNWKLIEKQTLEKIADFQKRVKLIRDPIAHTRGAVDAIAEDGLIESYILLCGRIPASEMFNQMASFQKKWHKLLSSTSSTIINEIGLICERLSKELPE